MTHRIRAFRGIENRFTIDRLHFFAADVDDPSGSSAFDIVEQQPYRLVWPVVAQDPPAHKIDCSLPLSAMVTVGRSATLNFESSRMETSAISSHQRKRSIDVSNVPNATEFVTETAARSNTGASAAVLQSSASMEGRLVTGKSE
jgi:hypothetical protein